MNDYRQYLRWFATTALSVIVLIGALNLFVDPYDRFGLNRLGTYISCDREYKNTEFPRFAPEAVLIGNSRAAMINVAGLKNYRFFNAAFTRAEGEEMRSFIERYVKDQKLVVLGLDVFSFEPLDKPVGDPFAPLTIGKALEYTLSLQNVEYSVRTIADFLAGKPRDYSPDGSFHEANWAVKVDKGDDELIRRKVRETIDQKAGYKLDPSRLQPLRDIRNILKKRGIELRVYLAPMHAGVWEGLRGTSGFEEMQRTREGIKEIFPHCIDLTESEYSAPQGFFRADPMHFRSALGEKFLKERVLNTKP